ncbi:MAG TPA: hypothetical protein VLC47_14945, partial [Burkholderiales bacterium]|nr:hypothetical protein [Burkholderiales bacterium]
MRRTTTTNETARGAHAQRRLLSLCAAFLLAACNTTHTYPPAAPSTGKRPAPQSTAFNASQLLKSDTDAAAEVHLQESLASARLLMEKLYR